MEKRFVEKLFKKELDSFEAPISGYRDFTIAVICKLPAYFTNPNPDGSDNGVVSHTKASVAFANALFALEEYRKMFGVAERDSIRAALLLHDGLYYGTGDEKKVCPDHPELMALLIESEAWETSLPSFLRSDIVSAIRKHSGHKTMNGIGVEDASDIDRFVHMCVYLATRRETTVQLPGTEEYYRRNLGQNTLDIDTAASIVRQITGGCRWDGQVYVEGDARFVILDGNKVCVAEELRDAFLVVGQARAASIQNPGYLYAGETPGQNQPEPQGMPVFQWNEFISLYPDWNKVVYGMPGELFIQSCGQNVPISDAQAAALGVSIP